MTWRIEIRSGSALSALPELYDSEEDVRAAAFSELCKLLKRYPDRKYEIYIHDPKHVLRLFAFTGLDLNCELCAVAMADGNDNVIVKLPSGARRNARTYTKGLETGDSGILLYNARHAMFLTDVSLEALQEALH